MSQQFPSPTPDSTPAPAGPSGADFLSPAPGPSGADFLAPAPVRPNNLALGIVAALVATLAAAAAYGGIMNAIEREIGYAAVGVGALIGFAAGKLGGRNPALPVIAAVLSAASVFLGQLFYDALYLSGATGAGVGDVLSTLGVSGLVDIWKENDAIMSSLFLALGAFAGFSTAKKIGA
ncbi:hypothetical protein OHA37_14750 [Streptomyces sp. NBC_00335]|uniref:hypothetical protein n=1 Tax=unclassified Streptomyces TaxID=2593676 RepID=UPI002258DD75|nr:MULTISPECIES: hypothetical protein [unclassified Streptomyces]MCX5405141.1 hypothetical protein [Streptomyces sp. NBC_00086]